MKWEVSIFNCDYKQILKMKKKTLLTYDYIKYSYKCMYVLI